MKRNKMGNLLSIAGDDAEDIKRFIDSFLSQDSESDDPEEKCVDFCKIIAVADPEDEEECLREWGVKQNASNTSVIYEGEGQPPAIAHLIFFDSEEIVPAIVRALANKRPDLYFRFVFGGIILRQSLISENKERNEKERRLNARQQTYAIQYATFNVAKVTAK